MWRDVWIKSCQNFRSCQHHSIVLSKCDISQNSPKCHQTFGATFCLKTGQELSKIAQSGHTEDTDKKWIICFSAIQERSRRRIVITFNRVSELRDVGAADFETMLTPSPKNSIRKKIRRFRQQQQEEQPQQREQRHKVAADGQTAVFDKGNVMKLLIISIRKRHYYVQR